MIFLLSSSLEKQGIPYRAAKQICIKGRIFQKGESFARRASFQALAQCESQQLEGINCLIVKSNDMLTIWREIPRHDIALPATEKIDDRKVIESVNQDEFFNRVSSSTPVKNNVAVKAKPIKANQQQGWEMPQFSHWFSNA